MANAVNWFEIPVFDFERAKNFYTKVIGGEMHIEDIAGIKMGFLPMEGEGVGGAIVDDENSKPSADGPTIYLNGKDDLSDQLSRVEESGGKVLLPKTKISDEIGFYAIFLDTEGNKLGFHSPN